MLGKTDQNVSNTCLVIWSIGSEIWKNSEVHLSDMQLHSSPSYMSSLTLKNKRKKKRIELSYRLSFGVILRAYEPKKLKTTLPKSLPCAI